MKTNTSIHKNKIIWLQITLTLAFAAVTPAKAQSKRSTKKAKTAQAQRSVAQVKSSSVNAYDIGQKQFRAGQFSEAQKSFQQALDLNSKDEQSRLMLAITLYRLNNFSESLAQLNQIMPTDNNKIDIKHYRGLIEYQNKNYAAAQTILNEVRESQDPIYSALAAFYQGLCLIELDQLEEAKTAFEFVIDNSQNDPELDKNAERRIEEIAGLLEIKKTAAVKYFVNASIGLNYDSNILYIPDNNSAASTPYDEGGGRWLFMGDAAYRFFYTQKHEYSAKFTFLNMQSFSTDFVQADPRMFVLSTPYIRNGTYNNRNFRLTLTPAFEMLYMDFDRSGEMTNVNNAAHVGADFMLFMTDRWFSSTFFEYRRDDSKLPGIADDSVENADANKFTIRKSETLLLGKAKKRMLIASAGYVQNVAKGDEKKYTRPELSVMFTAPVKKSETLSWLTGLAYYRQSFDDGTAGRIDSNMAYSLGLTKTIDAQWSWNTIANFTVNDSNEVASDYSKYLVMATINYAWSK